MAGSDASPGASPRRLAMDLLARREHSLAELRAKLAARDIPAADIDATLQALSAEGLVSDARFAEAFVASRVRRGQGPVRIRAELRQRGVDAELAEAQLRAVDWLAEGQAVRTRKFGAAPPAGHAGRARQARFLQYRGFTGEQIGRIFDASRDHD